MKKIAKAAIFLLLCAVLLAVLSGIFQAKFTNDNCQTYMADELYRLEPNSVEVVFCGSSQVVFGVSGMELYKEYGISAYSTGSPNQSILCSLGWLREIDKTQNIKVCLLDASQLMEISDESSYRQSIDPMHLSRNKLDIVRQHVAETQAQDADKGFEAADPLFSYVVPFLKYHARWETLTRKDFCYDAAESPLFRGNYPAYDVYSFSGYRDFMESETKKKRKIHVKAEQKAALLQMQAYCADHDIALIVFKTPKADWTETKQKRLRQLTEELGLPYLDYASEEGCRAMGLDLYSDMKDPQHLNLRGAEKLSDVIGAYLKERYDLTDFRKTAPMDEAMLQAYDATRSKIYFRTESDVVAFLTRLQEDYLSTGEYDLVLELSDDGICDAWTQDMQDALEGCGLRTDIAKLKGKTYAASIVHGEVEEKIGTSHELTLEGTLSNGGSFSAVSARQSDRLTRPEIKTDGRTTEFTAVGLNLVLYRSETREFAAQTAIARCPDGKLRANLAPER